MTTMRPWGICLRRKLPQDLQANNPERLLPHDAAGWSQSHGMVIGKRSAWMIGAQHDRQENQGEIGRWAFPCLRPRP